MCNTAAAKKQLPTCCSTLKVYCILKPKGKNASWNHVFQTWWQFFSITILTNFFHLKKDRILFLLNLIPPKSIIFSDYFLKLTKWGNLFCSNDNYFVKNQLLKLNVCVAFWKLHDLSQFDDQICFRCLREQKNLPHTPPNTICCTRCICSFFYSQKFKWNVNNYNAKPLKEYVIL